jgi:hypothetical protein
MGAGMKWLCGLIGLTSVAAAIGSIASGKPLAGIAVGLFGVVCLGFPILVSGSRDHTARTETKGGETIRVYPLRRMAGIVLLQWAFALSGIAMALGADQMAADGSGSATEYRVAGILCAVVFGGFGLRTLPYLFREAYVALRPDGIEFHAATKFFVPWRSVRAAWETRYRRNTVLAFSLDPDAPLQAGLVTRLSARYTHGAQGWDVTLSPVLHDPALVGDVYDHLKRYGVPDVAIGVPPHEARKLAAPPRLLSP